MSQKKKTWSQYHSSYLNLGKKLATSELPLFIGPYTKNDAYVFAKGFYRFRTALRDTHNGEEYPVTLCKMLDILVCSVEQSGEYQEPDNWVVRFRLDPIVAADPAAVQTEQLAKALFIKKQMPTLVSDPIFSDEEMKDRLREIAGGER